MGVEKPVRRIIGAILKDKRLIAFLIEGSGSYVSKAVAIDMAERTSTLSWRIPLMGTSTCARLRIRHRTTTF